jgi:broad specificity phosphatase PhoE
MTTHLLFIRHARSTWNDVGRWQGQADPPLSETGLGEARLLAERLRLTRHIDHIYASDLQRAATTAGIVAEALGRTVTLDPVWRERGIGQFEGLTNDEIQARFPDEWASMRRGPMVAPGGEPTEAVLARAIQGCDGLLARHADQTVAVVSHGGMILATLVHLLGLGPVGYAVLVGGRHTAISEVRIEDGHLRLERLNDYAHLELAVTA